MFIVCQAIILIRRLQVNDNVHRMGMFDSYNHAQISSDNQIVINDEDTDRPKIKSSTFCKVLRIVAGLAPPAPKSLIKGKDRAPTRRPPVWAEVILCLLSYDP